MKAAAVLLLLLCSPAWGQALEIPDHQRTPGAINPAVTHNNIFSTVCLPKWTKTIRPPQSYIERLKRKQIRDMRQAGDPQDYHEDHIVPLCVGGHPIDPRNLWPQPLRSRWADEDKNQLERSVCRMLCRGDITLEAAESPTLQLTLKCNSDTSAVSRLIFAPGGNTAWRIVTKWSPSP